MLLQGRRFEDGVDGFALGGVDEAAGIHQDDVGGLEVADDLGPMADQIPHEPLGIDRRLVAAERDDAELHR